MRNRHKGFTLTEMIVVMGIIVVFIALAVPTVRSLMGSNSISVAQNSIASLLTRAREDAIAIQDIRGVMFFRDTHTDRIVGAIVQPAAIQGDPSFSPPILMLDATPNRDSVPLPSGIRLQTVFNGTTGTSSSTGAEDRYLGFNPFYATAGNTISAPGGVILFDASGRVINRAYGFQMNQPGSNPMTASAMCLLLSIDPSTLNSYAINYVRPTGASSMAFIPGWIGRTTPPATPILSQVGFILFDYGAFKSLGFTDEDTDIKYGGTSNYSTPWTVAAGGDGIHSEKDEETWLDTNSTPLMVNRYNGTLIRAE